MRRSAVETMVVQLLYKDASTGSIEGAPSFMNNMSLHCDPFFNQELDIVALIASAARGSIWVARLHVP